MIGFLFGFLLAVVSFHINHLIKRMVDVKYAINTLFDVYGDIESFEEYDREQVLHQLMLEILNIEKMHDGNPYVKHQIAKLKKLRKLYKHAKHSEDFSNGVKIIQFEKLGRSFLILSLLNLNPKLLFTEYNNTIK
jgi:hypothetical protein